MDWEWVRDFMAARLDALGSGCGPVSLADVDRFAGVARDPRNWCVKVSWGEQRRAARDICATAAGGEGLVIFAGVFPSGTYEGHAVTGMRCWGWDWVRASREVLRWFFGRAPCAERVETYVSAGNRVSLAYVRRCGFRQMGASGAGKVWFELRRDGL